MEKLTVLGVTGGTGVGKGVACEIMRDNGAYIVDTDLIAHQIILKGKPAYSEIINKFGDGITDADGEIDRRRLGAMVFADESKLKELTRITHKYIIGQALSDIEAIQKNRNGYKFIAIDAPLLIESGMNKLCDATLGIYASERRQMERILKRDAITEEQAAMRIKRQTPFTVLRENVDFLIKNDGDYSEFTKKIERYITGFYSESS